MPALGAYLRIIRDMLTWSAVGLTVYSGLAYFALAIPKLENPHPDLALLTLPPILDESNMDWIESLALGVVQGLTEFLPISSDGHLDHHPARIRAPHRQDRARPPTRSSST